MKNNTGRSKTLLEQALRSLPGDNALQGTRYHVNKALDEIRKIEKKRRKREHVETTAAEEWQEKMKLFTMPPEIAKTALENIDSMISQEQDKIDKIKNKDNNDNNDNMETFID